MSSITKPISQFLCKRILLGSFSVRALAQSGNVCLLRLFSISSSDENRSFTVSYLINSLGFSPKVALFASRFVKFYSPEKPDKAIEFLKGFGFTHTQILNVVRKSPQTLTCDCEKIILPKFEFLLNKGISVPELAKGTSVYPVLLRCSLDKQIIPTFEFFKSLFQSEKNIVTAFKRYPPILGHGLKTRTEPNVAVLRELGVSDSNIAILTMRTPRVIVITSKLFRRIVEEVVAMGFDTSKVNFVVAVSVISKLSKEKWESKLGVYKKWSWSKEEVLEAFQMEPLCLMVSEDKLSRAMDFFTNKTCWRASDIAKSPVVLKMSLQKRLIPRFLVYQHLQSKGLVKKEISLSALFNTSNEKFAQRFITRYEKEAPELLKLYNGKFSSVKQSGEHSSTRSVLHKERKRNL